MDYFAMQACVFSCLLPLLAFVLLSLQFYKGSLSRNSRLPAFTLVQEFPSHLQDLVSIASDPTCSSHVSNYNIKASSFHYKSQGDIKSKQIGQEEVSNLLGNVSILKGCNSGLTKMANLNRLYFARSGIQILPNGVREARKRKNGGCNVKTFQATRLVPIVEGLQY